MSLGHSEVSFNHSCLKVPVNSSSRKPSPKYERLSSAKHFSEDRTQDKKKYPLSNLFSNFKSVKSYLEFYESIPDYSELHHLSNEEFYSRLNSLKLTQKKFCSESGVLCSADVEEETRNGRIPIYSNTRKSEEKKEEKYESCVCCPMCCCDKDYNYLSYNEKKSEPKVLKNCGEEVKQPPPKINVISDYENTSDIFETEFKKHSGYEADRESSTLFPGEKLSSKQSNVRDDCLGSCTRRSRSLPISPGYECETPEFCHRFSELSFRPNGCHSRYSSAFGTSDKEKHSTIKRPQKLHSRPIPLTSRIPLFDKIMMEKEARRRILHDRYSEELRSIVKPFSFTKREEEREKLRMISSNPELTSYSTPVARFKAKPIPKNLFSNYAYERMKEEEFYRALKRKIRAEELLKSSSLPPSMALRERMKYRSKSLDFLDSTNCQKRWNKEHAYRKACDDIKKEIEFDEKTKLTPHKKKLKSNWMFKSRRVNSATDSSTEISPYESVLERESRRKTRPYSALSCSRNNLASVLRIETARKRLEKEMEEKLRENRMKNDAKFKARLVRMTPAWRALSYDKNEDLALRMAVRREEERVKKKKHQRLMESIYDRVYNMPPLFHEERFPSNKTIQTKSFHQDKDSVTFSYDDTVNKIKTNDTYEESEEQKNETANDTEPYGIKNLADQKDETSSRESSELTGKIEKEKVYESDDTV